MRKSVSGYSSVKSASGSRKHCGVIRDLQLLIAPLESLCWINELDSESLMPAGHIHLILLCLCHKVTWKTPNTRHMLRRSEEHLLLISLLFDSVMNWIMYVYCCCFTAELTSVCIIYFILFSFLFITVQLFWNNLYCIKCYRNNSDLSFSQGHKKAFIQILTRLKAGKTTLVSSWERTVEYLISRHIFLNNMILACISAPYFAYGPIL